MKLHALLDILADGRFHSGAEIGQLLGVSRASVWKGMQALADLGVCFDSVRGKGYRLAWPMVLLDAESIRAGLPADIASRLKGCEAHFSLDSTSSELDRCLKALPSRLDEGEFRVCVSERQTAGRGRRGREWVSPLGSGLFFSLARCFHHGLAGLEAMSLVSGIAVARTLAAFGVQDVGLKWPNDVLGGGGKLAGILLEMTSTAMGEYTVIFGIGINVSPGEQQMRAVTQPWGSLEKLSFRPDRNRLAAVLATELVRCIDGLQRYGFASYLDEWQRLDCMHGKQGCLHLADGSGIEGHILGVSEQGALRLQTAAGIREFSGGEVSLRAVQSGPVS